METESAEPRSTERLAVPTHDPSVMKLTRGHSCVLCQQRKVRCDKQKPCANCVKAQVECRVVPPQPPRRRKKKPHERDLIERLKKYEALMSQHGVAFDPIGHDFKPPDGTDDVTDLEQDLSGLKTSSGASTREYNSPGSQEAEKPLKWFPYYKEYRAHHDDMLTDSSDEDFERPTIHHAFDTMFDNTDGFPFVVGGSQVRVTNSHPSAIQIFQLWQIYINNINPLLKISHVPTLQAQIVGAGADPSKISRPLEALMFAIYFIAVTSMKDEEVQSTFGEDRAVLLTKYHGATQQALVNANFMRSTEIMVLQALFLYLISVVRYVDPRSHFCLIGIAVRIATRLGLHRDGAQFNLPPFETEQRRRLWWQIVALDKRIAEITGSAITALSSSGGDCRLPLNVNDTDLYTHAKDPPAPYGGPTEMLFCLTRVEMTVAAAPGGVRPNPVGAGNRPRVQYSPSPSSPDVVTHVANQILPHDLEAYCAYIESVYLKHCDPKNPLHFFTLTMTRMSLCKLRIIGFMCRGVAATSVDDVERDALFVDAIQMVEFDNVIYSTDAVRGFLWYTNLHFPLPAYIFLVSELRRYNTGELCERAWQAICDNHEHRGLIRNLRSPMHIAFGNLFIKAWDAHEDAELQLGRTVQAPRLITLLRQHRSRYVSGVSMPSNAGQGKGAPGGPGPNPAAGGAPGNPDVGGPGAAAGDPSGMYSGGKPGPETARQMGQGPGAMTDDSMMFPSVDMANHMFNSTFPDLGNEPMDWNYLMQYGGFPGFTGHPAVYAQQGGGPHPQPPVTQ